MEEIWKDIPEYEGMYQVSNLGRVKSLNRITTKKDGTKQKIKECILSKRNDKYGYKRVNLYNKKGRSVKLVYRLVAESFLGHKCSSSGMVVDHINNDKEDDSLSNLQVISTRENVSKDRAGGTSEFIGVWWNGSKWVAEIEINRKGTYLGAFTDELEASEAYQSKLKEITHGEIGFIK